MGVLVHAQRRTRFFPVFPLFSSPIRHFVGTWTCPSLLTKSNPSLPFSVLSHTEREEPCSRWVLDRRITRATGLIKSPCCPFIYLFLSSVLGLPLSYLQSDMYLTDIPHLPSDRRQTAQTRSPRNPSGLIDRNNQNRTHPIHAHRITVREKTAQ